MNNENNTLNGAADNGDDSAIVALLPDNQSLFRKLIANSSDNVAFINKEGMIVYTSPATEHVLGYSEAEYVGRNGSEFIHPDDLDHVSQLLVALQDNLGGLFNAEYRVRHKDGTWLWMQGIGTNLLNEGSIQAIVIHYRNITERKRDEEIQSRLAAIVEFSDDAIISKTCDGTVMTWNEAATKLFGYAAAEMVGKSITLLIPATHAEEEAQILEKLVNGDRIQHFETVRVRKDGTQIHVSLTLSPIKDATGKVIAISKIARDISSRKAAEEAIHFQAELLASVGESVIATDTQGQVTYLNEAAEVLYGWAANEALGRNIQEQTIPEISSEQVQEMTVCLQVGERRSGEFIGIARNGRQFPILVTNSPTFDENGILVGVISVSRDITERKRVESALQESDRFGRATVDALSAHIAILDETGTIIAVNQAWKNFAADNEASGLSTTFESVNYLTVCDEAIGPDAEVATVFAAGVRAVMHRDRKDFSLEYPCHSPNEQRWFSGRVTRFSGDGSVRVVITHENITERKQIENELRSLYDATSFLFKSDTLMNLGYQVVQAVITAFEHVHCALLLKEKMSGEIIRFTRSGVYEVSTKTPLAVDGHGLVPEAFRTGKTIYSPDVEADQLYLANDPRSRSELVIPLQTASGTLGVLDLQSMKLDAFSERDQRILSAFAERAAAAIETMQLYEEINRHAAELEWRVSKRTAELQRAKEQVEAILNQSSDAIMLINSDINVQQTNLAFSHLLGYTMDEAFGQNIRVLAEPAGAQILIEAIEKVMLMHEPHRIEIALQRIDGSTFDADVALAPLTRYETNNVTVICSIRDNTERKLAEADLRKALTIEKELNELKSRFVSMVSHDFRTPLATIQSSSDLLRHYNDRMTAERKEEHFNTISGQIQHLTGLLEDVITISQAESGGLHFNPVLTDLAMFCEKIADEIQMLAGTRQVKFRVNSQKRLIAIDTKLLRRVIVNLLSNAVKYSPEDSVIEFNLLYGNEQVVIRIKDQGIGIPEADLNHLFEVFHRAINVGSIPGTGLGLAIVKQSLEAHGGSIGVESHIDLGTTFTISLPLNPVKDAVA
jgi:PAS domain S-box-containing protein